jgi:hypothetical protein
MHRPRLNQMEKMMNELELESLKEVLGGVQDSCPKGSDRTTTVHPNGSRSDGCE